MSIHLEKAVRLNVSTADPKAEAVIDQLIEHIRVQDKRIAALEDELSKLKGAALEKQPATV